MNKQIQAAFQGRLLDEEMLLDRRELMQLCGISEALLVDLVQEGLVRPLGKEPREWRFTGLEFRRLQRALRIHRDLEIDWPSTALALELLDELEALRLRVRCLEQQLGRGCT